MFSQTKSAGRLNPKVLICMKMKSFCHLSQCVFCKHEQHWQKKQSRGETRNQKAIEAERSRCKIFSNSIFAVGVEGARKNTSQLSEIQHGYNTSSITLCRA